MNRIRELARQFRDGKTSPKAFRSALVAQLSMLSDDDTKRLAFVLEGLSHE